MAVGRPKVELVLSAEERAQAASRSLPHAMVARAQLVLWAAQGESNRTIAERLGWSMPTVGKWRQRFVERRIAGLHDELRPGRPRSYGRVSEISCSEPYNGAPVGREEEYGGEQE